MSSWILHIVGETIDDDLEAPLGKFVKEIEALSHRVLQIRLTTDEGEKVVKVAHEVESVADTAAKDVTYVDPSLAADATAADKLIDTGVTDVDTGVTDVEAKEASLATPVVPSTVTPSPTTAPVASSPVTETTPPVVSVTPTVDPTATPTTGDSSIAGSTSTDTTIPPTPTPTPSTPSTPSTPPAPIPTIPS